MSFLRHGFHLGAVVLGLAALGSAAALPAGPSWPYVGMAGGGISVVSFNPLSARAEGRLEEISQELSGRPS